MLRSLIIAFFCAIAFSLSAQSFQDEIPASEVPQSVKLHALEHDGESRSTWQRYGNTYIFTLKQEGAETATELEITEKEGIVRQTEIYYDKSVPASKAGLSEKVNGSFGKYEYQGYGDTKTAAGDELTAVYLKTPGPGSRLVIFFDSTDMLVARRLHKIAQ